MELQNLNCIGFSRCYDIILEN